MKIEWAAEDIRPGRIVGHPDRRERWMIGYLPNATDPSQWALVSLSDGMIAHIGLTAEGLAEHLNASKELPVEFFSDPSHTKRGRKGGNARAASLSPERRSEIASAAASVRWNGQR